MPDEVEMNLDELELYLSAAGPRGLGGGFVPFGFYKVKVKKTQTKLIESKDGVDPVNIGLPGTVMWMEILGGTDNDQTGEEIRPYIAWNAGPNARVNPSDEKEQKLLDAMTAQAKQFLVACKDGDEEYAAKIRTKKGKAKLNIAEKLAPGTIFYVMHDPADRAASPKQYDSANFLTSKQFEQALEGKLKYRRKNSAGLSPEEAAKLGIKTGDARQSRRSGAAAGGVVPDTAWKPPADGTQATQPGKGQGAQTQEQPAPAAQAADAEGEQEEVL